MATQFAQVDSIKLEAEALAVNSAKQEFAYAEVAFEMPAYTASSDSGQLGGGGSDRGVSTSDTLATMIQKTRRDGKTVTVKSAMLARPGKQGATAYYVGTIAVSGGNVTFEIKQVDESTEIDAANGVHDQPIVMLVRYSLA
jgi:nitrogen-specific signal transduction histidine kinase